ncbi:MAG: STAS domain-containing protein [Actinomycetota bacterium]
MGDPGASWESGSPHASIEIVIGGPLPPEHVPRLWERVGAIIEGAAAVVVCDVAALDRPDAETVEVLARLQLAARRSGCRVRLRHACGELRDLLELMGLSEVVPCSDLETRREIEQREPPRGVEEERDPFDPVA